MNPKKLAEAALFMATEPMDLGQLAAIMSLGAVGQAKSALQELMEEYQNKDSALEVTLFEDRYRMRVKDEYLPKVAHLTLSTDYSRAALKTLSVVAFKQPILQSEVVKIRGQGTYEHVKELSLGGLLSGKKQGRSKLLSTTKRFEDYFGTSIEKLKETYGDIEFFVPEEEGSEVMGEQTGVPQEEVAREVQTAGEEEEAEEPQGEMTEEEEEAGIEEEETGEPQEQTEETQEETPEEQTEEAAEEQEVEESAEQEQEAEGEETGAEEAREEEENVLLPSERAEQEASEDIYSEEQQKDTNEHEG